MSAATCGYKTFRDEPRMSLRSSGLRLLNGDAPIEALAAQHTPIAISTMLSQLACLGTMLYSGLEKHGPINSVEAKEPAVPEYRPVPTFLPDIREFTRI
jgi:hypothetical protein